MSIEIYNKAKVIKKDDKIYYFLKYHSKNDCICGGQTIIDDNFKNKYIKIDSRAGSWSLIAVGTELTHNINKILLTEYNCPTSHIYGQIMFGNKKNIALYWAKQTPADFYAFDNEQQKNINDIIKYANSDRIIDLENVKDNQKIKAIYQYCDDKDINLADNQIIYKSLPVWDLDNL